MGATVRPPADAADAAPRRDIKALTGLRAVAATLVVLFHMQYFCGPYLDSLPMLRPLVAAGWTGVELFFVLSGFVITLSYAEKLGSRPSLGKAVTFVLNRVARVWPAWAVVTVLMGGWVYLLRSRGLDADVITPHPDADLPSLLGQLSMTQMWQGGGPIGASYVLPGWSISAEWAAYLAFPVLAVLLRPARHLPAGVLLVLSVAAMAPLSVTAFTTGTPDFEQSWLLRITCGFLAGMLAALAVRRVRSGGRIEASAPTLLWTSLVLIAAGVSWSWWRRAEDMSLDYASIVAVVFPLLVVSLALTEQGPARWLATPAMTYGGRISYCLYLVHFLVLDVVVTIWWQAPAARQVVTPGLALAVPGVVLVSFLLSAALHHAVEEPGRRAVLRLTAALLDRLPSARRSPVAAPAPAPVLAAPAVPAVAVAAAARPQVSLAALAAAADRTDRLRIVEPRTEVGVGFPRVPAAVVAPRDGGARELAG